MNSSLSLLFDALAAIAVCATLLVLSLLLFLRRKG